MTRTLLHLPPTSLHKHILSCSCICLQDCFQLNSFCKHDNVEFVWRGTKGTVFIFFIILFHCFYCLCVFSDLLLFLFPVVFLSRLNFIFTLSCFCLSGPFKLLQTTNVSLRWQLNNKMKSVMNELMNLFILRAFYMCTHGPKLSKGLK